MTIAARASIRTTTPYPAAVTGVTIVAATYELARLVAHTAMDALAGASPSFDPVGETLGGVAVGATLVILAGRLDGARSQRTAVLSLLSFASVVAVMIEGSAFAPALSPVDRLPLAIVLQLGVSTIAGAAAVAVTPRPSIRGVALPASPSPAAFARGVGAGALAYAVAYLVSGALTYVLVTGPYYAAHEGGLQTPSPSIVIVVAVFEGLLMALATVPLARALPGSTWSRAALCGLSLWVLGGVAPLLQQSRLPDVIRVASAVEIVFQKVPVGIVIARRFRR